MPTPHPLPSDLPFLSPFSHASEFGLFAELVIPLKNSHEMEMLEQDMEDTGLESAVDWPRGVLEWVWRNPGRYAEVREVMRGCVRDFGFQY
jgi:hypothetical protein